MLNIAIIKQILIFILTFLAYYMSFLTGLKTENIIVSTIKYKIKEEEKWVMNKIKL